MDLMLADKRALVTGASSGIGVEIAALLAREGVSVVVQGRDRARTEQTVRAIEQAGVGKAIAQSCLEFLVAARLRHPGYW